MGKDDFLTADDACGSSIRSSLCSGCTKPPPPSSETMEKTEQVSENRPWCH
ncbi:hypothetical protein K435DRAFT_786928, partial [Dendrothele bispora CBS 962.96]